MVVELHGHGTRRRRHIGEGDAGERLTNQVVELSGGAHLQQARHTLDELVRLARARDREEKLRRGDVLVLVERRGVNRWLHDTQWNRHRSGGNHGLEQLTQLPVQLSEARAELVMLIARQVTRMDAH